MAATTKSARTDEWKPKPTKMRIAAMRIVWGEAPIVAPKPRNNRPSQDEKNQNVWLVPSETTSKRYTVNLARKTCGCEWWRKGNAWCKHLEAARIWKARVAGDPKAEIVVGLDPVPNPYKQEPWYDAMSETEEVIVRELARCLGQHFGVERSPNRKNNAGRPGYAIGDFLACGIVAGYLNRPSRKAIPFMAAETGLVRTGKAPDPPTLRAAMKRPQMREAVARARRMIAMCTSKVDTVFTLDGTVMKTPLSQIHIVRAAGQNGKNKTKAVQKILNCKVHLAVGIETFVVYGVYTVDGDENDQLGFEPTMDQFVDFVRLDAVLADAGYDAARHYEYVGRRGGRAFINMKDNNRQPQAGMEHFNRALKDWREQSEEWTEAYPYRWLSESANSSYKRTIKRVIRARFEETREVEVGLSCLAFGLKWLAHARAKYGAEKVSIPWADAKALALIDGVVERCKGRRKPKTVEEAA